MKKVGKKRSKSGLIIAAVGVCSFAVTFLSQIKPAKVVNVTGEEEEEYEVKPVELTPQEKVLRSLTTMEGFFLDANLEIVLQDDSRYGFTFQGQGDAKNLEDFRLNGTGDVTVDGLVIPMGLGYFTDTVYFNYRENYFKMETQKILDFVKTLPDYNIQMSIPDEIANLDLNSIQEKIQTMGDVIITPTGEYYFPFELSEDVTLHIKTNENYDFTGIRTDHFYYGDVLFYLDVDIERATAEKPVEIEQIKGTELEEKYQDFSPALTIFDGVYNLINKKQFGVNLNLDLNQYDEDFVKSNIIGADINLMADMENKFFEINGGLSEKDRVHTFKFDYDNEKNIYAHYHNVNVSINAESVSELISYVLGKIGDDRIEELLGSVTELIKNSDVTETIKNVDNVLQQITLTENDLSVGLALRELGLTDVSDFAIKLNFTQEALQSIVIENLKYKTYEANVVLTFIDYNVEPFNKADYTQLEPALGIVDGIDKLIDKKQFRFEFNGLVDNQDATKNDVSIDGGLQFDIENNFGYGDMTIVDSNLYSHNIKADMRSKEEIVFAYNDELKGKFNTNTLLELGTLIKTVVTEPDDHFVELFGSLVEQVESMPLMAAINNKDYGALLGTQIIRNLEVTDYEVSLRIGLDIIAMDDKYLDLSIKFNEEGIKSLDISNLAIGDNIISFSINLKEFNESLESTRLSQYDEYLDFSDIKVLLELGINTSKYNYYHFTTTAKLDIPVFGEKDVPIDVKVRTDHGDVQVRAEIDVPIISLANGNGDYTSTKSRKTILYYYDKMFYINRVDHVKKGLIFGSELDVRYTEVVEPSYFLDNIFDVLLKDMLGMKSLVMNLIELVDSSSGSSEPIKYEKILKDFQYNKSASYFFFDIDLAELTKNKNLNSLTLKAFVNDETKELTGLEVKVKITAISISANLTLVDKDLTANEENRIVDLEEFIAAHKDDAKHTLIKTEL